MKTYGPTPILPPVSINSVHPDRENEWQTVWGVQISGKGELLDEGAPGYTHGREIIKFESFLLALGRDPKEWPKGRKILKVTPSKISLFELGLLTKGFSASQAWEAKG